MTDSIATYRKKVIELHSKAFQLFNETLVPFEAALMQPRAHPNPVTTVMDMFQLQAVKAYGSVAILCQHGMMEDAATLARRMMEIAVQTVYIGAESDEVIRDRRAGMYLAFMWREIPSRHRGRLPPAARVHWSRIARRYGRYVPGKAKSWGPKWFDMFAELGAIDTYRSDYSFLSGVAHGRPGSQVFNYSSTTIRVHSHEFVSTLIAYATKYFLITAEQWNRYFALVPDDAYKRMVRRAIRFRPKARS